MKVTLSKHGGWAAGIQLGAVPRVIEATALPAPAAADLARLASAAEASPAVDAKAASRGGDIGTYSITIEHGGRTAVLRQSDTTMSPAFAALLEWIERHPTRT
jgi:hypothetical protein